MRDLGLRRFVVGCVDGGIGELGGEESVKGTSWVGTGPGG